jgi:hypothetical protein
MTTNTLAFTPQNDGYDLSRHFKLILSDVQALFPQHEVSITHAAGSPGTNSDICVRAFYACGCDLMLSESMDPDDGATEGQWDLIWWCQYDPSNLDTLCGQNWSNMRMTLDQVTPEFVAQSASALVHSENYYGEAVVAQINAEGV